MSHLAWTTVVGLLMPLSVSLAQTNIEQPPDTIAVAPLFENAERLSLILRAPFNSLLRNRDDDAPAHPATILHIHGTDTTSMELEVELRGNNRRRNSVCNFPPLRLDFPRSEMDGTIFHNQNRIKLVTHCQTGRDRYEDYVVLEYLIYRALNVLTDLSFRVRLADLTYVDTEGEKETISRVGFLIEDDDDMAERNGWEVLEIPRINPMDVDPWQLNLVEVFQFMIGHTDWSAFAGQQSEDTCCHNGRLIGTMAGPVYPVPYDFDFAGLINARYAEVAEAIGTRSVRQRVYRGVCHDDGVLEDTLQRFIDAKDDIYALFQDYPTLEDRSRKQAIEYLDDFYKIATEPNRARRDLARQCRQI